MHEHGVKNISETGDISVDFGKLETSRHRFNSGDQHAVSHALRPEPGVATLTFSRRASSPTGEQMPASLGSPSHIATPGSNSKRHVAFASTSLVPDSPFTSTLKYFKQLKDKESSPSKSRRNASLPEEIAQLAKEAQHEDGFEDIGRFDEGIEDMEQYRDMDLAPLDPVMEDGIAGDLIILGTPTKPRVETLVEATKRISSVSSAYGSDENQVSQQNVMMEGLRPGLSEEVEGVQYELEIPGHYGDLFYATIRTKAPVWDIARFIRESGKLLDAPDEAIEAAVQVNHVTDGLVPPIDSYQRLTWNRNSSTTRPLSFVPLELKQTLLGAFLQTMTLSTWTRSSLFSTRSRPLSSRSLACFPWRCSGVLRSRSPSTLDTSGSWRGWARSQRRREWRQRWMRYINSRGLCARLAKAWLGDVGNDLGWTVHPKRIG
jgi:hypothetical protein